MSKGKVQVGAVKVQQPKEQKSLVPDADDVVSLREVLIEHLLEGETVLKCIRR